MFWIIFFICYSKKRLKKEKKVKQELKETRQVLKETKASTKRKQVRTKRNQSKYLKKLIRRGVELTAYI